LLIREETLNFNKKLIIFGHIIQLILRLSDVELLSFSLAISIFHPAKKIVSLHPQKTD